MDTVLPWPGAALVHFSRSGQPAHFWASNSTTLPNVKGWLCPPGHVTIRRLMFRGKADLANSSPFWLPQGLQMTSPPFCCQTELRKNKFSG